MKFTKKLLTTTLMLLLAFVFLPCAVFAAEPLNVTIDGEEVIFPDEGAARVDGRALVPVRGVFEVLGFNVRRDRATQTVTIANADYEIQIVIGEDVFTVNGVPSPNRLDVPAQVIGGRTMIPIRFPLEAVGFNVRGDSATRTVVITSPGTAAGLALPEQMMSAATGAEIMDYLSVETRVSEIRGLAEGGDATAQLVLGMMYRGGHGVGENQEEALKWARLAAEQGNARAMIGVGWSYYSGNPVEENQETAVYWWRLAAEAGIAAGQFNLGVSYNAGLGGITPSRAQANYWWRLAAEQGSVDSQMNLGWSYHVGNGITRNTERAVYWMQLAAAQGDVYAQKTLDYYMHIGETTPEARESFLANFDLGAAREFLGFDFEVCIVGRIWTRESDGTVIEWRDVNLLGNTVDIDGLTPAWRDGLYGTTALGEVVLKIYGGQPALMIDVGLATDFWEDSYEGTRAYHRITLGR